MKLIVYLQKFNGTDANSTERLPISHLNENIMSVDIRKVVELGITPRSNTGIAHKAAGIGQVGAGLVRPPMSVFEDALVAYAERYLQ